MKPRMLVLGALLAWTLPSAFAHRLDEYLQASFVSVEPNRVTVEMLLTPGTAVLSHVLADIDADGNGLLSNLEQTAYAAHVLREVSLTLNGERLAPKIMSVAFDPTDAIKEGVGSIHLEFAADLPASRFAQKLRLENHHRAEISVYQVNSLASSHPAIRFGAEERNPSQSVYELNYTQGDDAALSPRKNPGWNFGAAASVGVCLLLGATWCALGSRRQRLRRVRRNAPPPAQPERCS